MPAALAALAANAGSQTRHLGYDPQGGQTSTSRPPSTTTVNGVQPQRSGPDDGFVTAIASTGALVWSTCKTDRINEAMEATRVPAWAWANLSLEPDTAANLIALMMMTRGGDGCE